MKKGILFTASLMIGLLMFTTSCSKEGCTDTTATNYSSEADKDNGSCHYETLTPSNSGGLTVKVKTPGGTGYLTDVEVGIAVSLDDAENDNWIDIKAVNSSGVADFGQLLQGTYFYACSAMVNGVEYFGYASTQVINGTTKNMELSIE